MSVFLFIVISIIPSIVYCVSKPGSNTKEKVIYIGTAKFNEVK